jgi:hypothetical protein
MYGRCNVSFAVPTPQIMYHTQNLSPGQDFSCVEQTTSMSGEPHPPELEDQDLDNDRGDDHDFDDEPRASTAVRFPAWVGLFAFSLISMIAIIFEKHGFDGAGKWAIIVTVLSTCLGVVGVAGYLFQRGLFMGQMPEIVVAGLSIAFWGLGLPAIMNPKHAIAVDQREVVNANLFFSSWACFCCCLWLVGSLAKEVVGFNIVENTPAKKAKIYGLVASSLVVMGSSIRVFRSFQCSNIAMTSVQVCRQSKFAISIGVIGFFVALAWTYVAHINLEHIQYEFYGSSALLIMWVFGLAFITFGDGPGASVGNLYFATWISLVLVIFLFADSLRAYFGGQIPGIPQNSTGQQTHETTVPEFSMDDDDDDV